VTEFEDLALVTARILGYGRQEAGNRVEFWIGYGHEDPQQLEEPP